MFSTNAIRDNILEVLAAGVSIIFLFIKMALLPAANVNLSIKDYNTLTWTNLILLILTAMFCFSKVLNIFRDGTQRATAQVSYIVLILSYIIFYAVVITDSKFQYAYCAAHDRGKGSAEDTKITTYNQIFAIRDSSDETKQSKLARRFFIALLVIDFCIFIFYLVILRILFGKITSTNTLFTGAIIAVIVLMFICIGFASFLFNMMKKRVGVGQYVEEECKKKK